jgi:hypothetical protein
VCYKHTHTHLTDGSDIAYMLPGISVKTNEQKHVTIENILLTEPNRFLGLHNQNRTEHQKPQSTEVNHFTLSAYVYHSTGMAITSYCRGLGVPYLLYIDDRLAGEFMEKNIGYRESSVWSSAGSGESCVHPLRGFIEGGIYVGSTEMSVHSVTDTQVHRFIVGFTETGLFTPGR